MSQKVGNVFVPKIVLRNLFRLSQFSIPRGSRTNLIVQGAPGGGPTPLPGQSLQITLTQRAPPVGLSEPMKLTSLGGKTVQVAPSGLLQHQKVPMGAQPAPGSLAGLGLAGPHLQQQAVLAASKPGENYIRLIILIIRDSFSKVQFPQN